MNERTKQLWVLFGLAAMIAMFCLFVAYLSLLALGSHVATGIGIAAMFSSVVFSASAAFVRWIRRQSGGTVTGPVA